MSEVDPNTFFDGLDVSEEEIDRSSSSSDDEETLASSRLLGRTAAKKKESSRWYQLVDQSDDDEIIEYFDRLGQVTRREIEETSSEGKKAGELEKDQERRMRQRSQFFETYSSDDDDARLVVSHKKRRIDELKAVIDRVNRSKEERDWVQITEEIKELDNKVIKNMLKMHQDFPAPPKRYFKFMIDLRDEVGELNKDRDYLQTLPPLQKKALSRLHGPLRNSPHLKEFSSMVDEYIENRDSYDVEENFGLEQEEETLKKIKEKMIQEDRGGSRADSGPSKWLLSDASDDSEDDSDDEAKRVFNMDSDDDSSDDDEKKTQKVRKGYKKKAKEDRDSESDDEEGRVDDLQIEAKVGEFRSTRGRRLFSNQEVIDQLTVFLKYVESTEIRIQVLTEIIATSADKYLSSEFYMTHPEWTQYAEHFAEVLTIMESNPGVKYVEERSGSPAPKQKGVVPISGNPLALVEHLDAQFYKGLKYGDSQSQEYIDRLMNQCLMLNILERTALYYEKSGQNEEVGRLSFRILSHIYYRRPSDHVDLFEAHKARVLSYTPSQGVPSRHAVPNTVVLPSREVITSNLGETVEKLTKVVLRSASRILAQQAVLMEVYHLAVAGHYAKARDLLVMSEIPDEIEASKSGKESDHTLDAALQVLFNRVIAQLGLSAFRNGQIRDTFHTLRDLFGYPGMIRGYLAQSYRFSKDSTKQDLDKRGKEELEKREKERFVPYHMHINTDAIEAAFMISTMLVETSSNKQMSLDLSKRRFQSLSSKKYFRQVEDRQIVTPEESTKDFLFAATVALGEGKWKECHKALTSLDIWNLFENKESIISMLETHVKVESLRTYVFSYLKHYQSLGLEFLSQLFELDFSMVHATLSRMISFDRLYAFIDEPTKTLKGTGEEPSQLHRVALQILDTATSQTTGYSRKKWNE